MARQWTIRVMPQCGVLGEAAGTASVLSIQENTIPRNIDVKKLQEMLKKQGCIIDENDIMRANK
ncbi:MAG: FAD-dependent oxidoreductase [Candidatus Poribacteria bacterium]